MSGRKSSPDDGSSSEEEDEEDWRIPSMMVDPTRPLQESASYPDPTMYLIELEDLKAHECFPSFDPDVVTITSKLDLSNALVVFLSHAWVEVPMKAKSRRLERKKKKTMKEIVEVSDVWFDGVVEESSSDEEVVAERNRPKTPDGCIKCVRMMDTFSRDKWQLTVEAADKIKAEYAPEMDKLYLWIDYCCLDPGIDANAHGLLMLDRIMQRCDCLLTVIVDKEYKDTPWTLSMSGEGLHRDYQSREWKRYLTRRWCRLEMAYGSNVPFLEAKHIEAEAVFDKTFDQRKNPLVGRVSENRAERLRGGLQYERLQARRAHLLYGTREFELGVPPKVLPNLEKSVVDEFYDPSGGHYSTPSDAPILERLNRELWPFTLVGEAGYKGERDSCGAVGQVGRKSGQGTMSWPNGNEYEGQWDKNEMDGQGIYRHTNGEELPIDVYQGNFQMSVQQGKGEYQRYDGAKYIGDWKVGRRHGFGIFTWSDGTTYRGDWFNDEREGFGLLTLAGGNQYSGYWKDGRRSGQGKMVWTSGAEYTGKWNKDRRHGQGTFTTPYGRGSIYKGGWKRGRKHGLGVLTLAPGAIEEDVLDGVFEADNFIESKAEEKEAKREAINAVFEVDSDESESELLDGEAGDSEKHFFSRGMRIFRSNSPDEKKDRK